jgi:hypothetical protein
MDLRFQRRDDEIRLPTKVTTVLLHVSWTEPASPGPVVAPLEGGNRFVRKQSKT